MAGIDKTQTLSDLEEQIGGPVSPMYVLASQYPEADGDSQADMASVLHKTWDDDGDTWTLALNGSGEDWYPTVSPVSDAMPDPCKVEVYAGSHLLSVDDEALAILHPGHEEYFVDQDVTAIWARAMVTALRDRLVELGVDLPPASEFLKEAP